MYDIDGGVALQELAMGTLCISVKGLLTMVPTFDLVFYDV